MQALYILNENRRIAMKKNYTIGLDIGTNSVGYAVVYDDYNLVSKKMKVFGNTPKKTMKKNFWGVRLFEEGTTAEARRLKRTTRRRYERRHNRLEKLQSLFSEEMNETDSNFFHRLEDSFLVEDEKRNSKYPIFGTVEEEVIYNHNYPTIYHLRKKLVDIDEKADLRLVYLACAHILKFRGHFLIEGNLADSSHSIDELFSTFIQTYNKVFCFQGDGSLIGALNDNISIENITKEKISRTRKVEAVLALFPGEKNNGVFGQYLKLIFGLKVNFKKIFDLTDKFDLEIPKESYEEDIAELLEIIGEEYLEIFSDAKNLYDAIVLGGILTVEDKGTNAKLSASMIDRYENHQVDLQKLKKWIKIYLPDEYYNIFSDKEKNGYAGYIDGKTKQSDFYDYLKKLLINQPQSEYFIQKIEQEDFLRKQRTFDNGVIPRQIHQSELEAILTNQAQHYPLLAKNKQEIIELFKFRIPYYIGPLDKNNQSDFSWLVRKTEDEITPLNIKKVVDYEASATAFIERMTNRDTYLPKEKVLPKNSLIYQKYMIFNELTKVTYIDDQGKVNNFSSFEKEAIFNKLFKVERKITKVKLQNFLKNEYHLQNPTINGIEESFNANYGTYHDLKKVNGMEAILEDNSNVELLEEIIKIITIFEDRKMISKQLEKYKERLSPNIIKELSRKKYTGWGRLSAKLIYGIRDKRTNKTILDYLINDDDVSNNRNRNFMQLINDDDLSFKEIIQGAQKIEIETDLVEIVRELPGSPAIKKGILQSIKIVDEIIAIMGYLPENIVIEMARENQTTQQGKANAKTRLKNLEEAIKELGSSLLKQYPVDAKDLQTDRLYLYYLQNGKDMYTGDDLDIHFLSSYDIDHIIPQSFITDNSLDNMVLVSSTLNRGKLDDVPSIDVVKKMEPYWKKLKESKLISQRKYDNLTKSLRGGLTEDDKANFIKRQLVETRQITKHVAQILDARFNKKVNQENEVARSVGIVTLKSSLVSRFRKDFSIHKVREVNDYHHAHDAYLNAVVAKTLLAVYPKLKPELVYGEYQHFNSHRENKATAKKEFYSNIMRFFTSNTPIVNQNGEILWNKEKDLAKIKQVLSYNQMNIVKKVEVQKGSFSNETILPKGESKKLIRRKNNLDPLKYGGFNTPTFAYNVAFTYEKGKNNKPTKIIIGIPIMDQVAFEKNSTDYLMSKGYRNPKVKAILPKFSLYSFDNGRRRFLSGGSEAQKANQFVLPAHLTTLLYHAKHYDEIASKTSYDYVNEHVTQFADVLTYIVDFSQEYILADKNLQKIKVLYEKNKNSDPKIIAESMINLLTFTFRGAPADFKFFGENISRSRYNNISELWQADVIYQSITGLYETRIKLGE